MAVDRINSAEGLKQQKLYLQLDMVQPRLLIEVVRQLLPAALLPAALLPAALLPELRLDL